MNYELIDYKILKRRQYCLNFRFLILEINNDDPSVYLDIVSRVEDSFNIFIVINNHYIEDLYNILYYYNAFIVNIPFNFIYIKLNELNNYFFDDYYNKFDHSTLLEDKIDKKDK